MSDSLGRTIFQLAYEISPIIFTGGIAGGIPGLLLPIVALTQAAGFVEGILGGSVSLNPDTYLCHFAPMPGSTLIDNQIGHYPFANQTIAANAVITQPLTVSLRMTAPATGDPGWLGKLATFVALKATIDQHIATGGTFTVATPSYIYTNCLLIGLKDISGGESAQPQIEWQWDFEQPLLTLDAAQNAQNGLMSKLTNGTVTDGSLSGPQSQLGQLLNSATPSLVPSARGLPGSGASGSVLSAIPSLF